MSALRDRCLAAIGIPVWVRRDAVEQRSSGVPPRTPVAGHSAQKSRFDSTGTAAGPRSYENVGWEELAAAVRGCTLCGLHRTRTQTVFGVGRRDADLLIIGEAPGGEEDRVGEPFVGPAGRLLNAMLGAIGLEREQVYIANILKCRPPGNRDPKPDEAATCTPYLQRQLELIEPRAILALGRIAGQWLLQSELPIGRLRGQVQRYGDRGTPLVVTYHPAYLLRTPLAKAKTWQDLCLIRDLMTTKP